MQVAELRKRTNGLPDDYLVTLVGDMITEEGLPTYMTMLNTLDGVRDETGASSSPWAQWTRKWTAEENRHGAPPPPFTHTQAFKHSPDASISGRCSLTFPVSGMSRLQSGGTQTPSHTLPTHMRFVWPRLGRRRSAERMHPEAAD